MVNRQKELDELIQDANNSLDSAHHASLLNELVHRSLIERLERAQKQSLTEIINIKMPEWKGSEVSLGVSAQRKDLLGKVVYNTEEISLVNGGKM